ncbi:MAG: hypothetical protein A3A94_01735 [Candidatus Portnoybacteria bacterium RIFCSPLOWO2_01_FULL_43_11]|uniref:Uncharacterized protein n=3 Tax=Candidatus Portnoyibacteriota TaxID=1817913 RepID=A0A1G2FCV9_9BACT|nr:MAG: hypothetical protein A2815_00480 [Candidatus Portnoybacteria bacterium RIFCSPHIGHO2_01_FULL_40_12b]OGZ39182.1 MAG: hypothetical protein A3A94_01735 [Candidatus Portnoybacteria bacterium RIFCSPLOWO2_01_FULL_43_11]OGZ39674.1 MAG: hypothetical protein A3I20_03540 [Candidatus Portnoybacteria bacterium RIFCSPLOWO2_02_FULL_40_15]
MRIIKQLIILLIFLSILSGIGFLIYWFNRPLPTCSDGIQNQEEEGVDCGGPCQSCEISALKPLEVSETRALRVKDNFYDLAARIKNPNQNYGSGRIVYHFKLYDSNNNLINEREGADYILPNQNKYLIVSKVESPRPIEKIELLFDQFEWQKLQDYQPPQLVVTRKEYSPSKPDEPGFSRATGLVINKTNFDFERIDVDILLLNSNRQIVGLNTTEIQTLLSNQERHFIAAWFEPIEDNIVSMEVEVETNLFDSDNYMKRHGAPEDFKDY